MSEYTYRHAIVNGGVVPPFITQQFYDETLQRVPLQEGDTIIDTYPKSGTTLTQYLLYLLLHGDIPKGLHLSQVVPWFDADTFDSADIPKENRIFKSHLSWKDMFKLPHLKYIYIARNIKDVCVSMFHHARGIAAFG